MHKKVRDVLLKKHCFRGIMLDYIVFALRAITVFCRGFKASWTTNDCTLIKALFTCGSQSFHKHKHIQSK